jgi:hypothetical protein
VIAVKPTRSSILLVLWIGVLAAPTSAARFDGVPFSSISEVFALALLLPLVFSSANRRLLSRALTSSPSWSIAAIVGAVLCAAALKAVLATTRASGFLACYKSTLSPPPAGSCERSFENPFFRFAATRVDATIDFTPANWNLSFVNSARFNFPPTTPGLRRADRMPLKIAWRGVVESGRQDAVVSYVGEGSVGIDATSIDLPPSYDRDASVAFTLPPGRHVMRVYYTFDDGSTTSERRRRGPFATIRVMTVDADGHVRGPLTAGQPSAAIRAAAAMLDVLVLGVSLALLVHYVWLLRVQRGSVAIVAVASAAAWFGVRLFGLAVGTGATVVVWSLLAVVVGRNRSARLLLAYIALLMLGSWIAVSTYPSLQVVGFRSRGDDWLTYESFARTILETWSLQGGEPVFYMQPFFRYVRFAEHLLLGDADPLIDVAAWVALHWTILWTAATLFPATGIGRARTVLFAVASALTLALAGSVAVVAMIRLSLSEHVTWIFTAAAFALLCGRIPRRWVVAAALLAAALITRPNQAPALFAIAAAFLMVPMSHRSRAAWIAAATFGAVCLLPLAHNVYYGGRAVIFTTTAGSPDTVGIPVATLARIGSDPAARAAVLQVIRGLLFLPPWRSSIGNDDVKFVMYGLQVVWLVALFLALTRSVPVRLRVLAFVPLVYLGVHLFYAVGNYYPRHILAAHFAMGLVTMTIAATPRTRRHEGTNVLLPLRGSGHSEARSPNAVAERPGRHLQVQRWAVVGRLVGVSGGSERRWPVGYVPVQRGDRSVGRSVQRVVGNVHLRFRPMVSKLVDLSGVDQRRRTGGPVPL